MSAPRLVLCGLEPGPAVALAAGALLAAFADERAVRPVLLGADLPLWRLCYGSAARTPRILDPRLLDDAAAGELYDLWADETDLTAHRRRRARAGPLGGRQGLARARRLARPRRAARPGRRRARARRHRRRLGVRPQDCWLAASSSPASSSSAATRQGRAAGLRERDRRRGQAAGARLGAAAAQRAVRAAVRLRRRGAAAADRPAAGQGRRGRAVPRGRHLPGPRRGSRRRPPGAASCRRGRAGCWRRCPRPPGSGSPSAWGPPLEPFALEAIDQFKALGLELEPVRLAERHRAPARRRRAAAGRPARRGGAGHVRRQRGAQDGRRRGDRRRPAHAGAGRRRTAAAPPPRRQPRALARAGRRPAGRGRAPRVVRAASLRPGLGRAREPLRGGRGHTVRAVRPRVPDAPAGVVRLAAGRAPAKRARSRGSCTSAASPPRSCPPCRRRLASPPASSPRCGWRRRTREAGGRRVPAALAARPAGAVARHHRGRGAGHAAHVARRRARLGRPPRTTTRSTCCATAARSSGTRTGTAAATAPSPTASSSTGWRSTSPGP